mgnify:CR=1 FL=1
MHFALAQEHQMLKDLVRKFVDAQLMPLESDVLARETAGKGSYLTKEEQARVDLVSKDLGLWGLDAPEEVGGMNLPMTSPCTLMGGLPAQRTQAGQGGIISLKTKMSKHSMLWFHRFNPAKGLFIITM